MNTVIRSKRLLGIVVAMMLLAGVASFDLLPRMEDPTLTERTAVISTVVPGASVRRVESLVGDKIVQSVQKFDEVKEVQSISRSGFSSVVVTLKDEITQVDEIWARLRNDINDLKPELPVEAQAPDVEVIRVRAFASVLALTWNGERKPVYSILGRYVDELADSIRNIRNTEDVDTFGMPNEEILVTVDSSSLAHMGLNPQKLSQLIEASDSKRPAGTLRTSENNILIEVGTELSNLERVERIPLRTESSGSTSYLGDVAKVEKTVEYPMTSEVIVDGKPAIMIAVSVGKSARLDRWKTLLAETVSKFEAKLPPDLKLVNVFDQERYVTNRIHNLISDLVLSAVALFFVVLLMMGWRNACIISVALPLASCIVFITFRVVGIPLHQMSLSGLVIALGMLEGTAIIVVDEIHRRIQSGVPSDEAIKSGISHLALPLFGSTITTVLSFLPIALMPGPSGEFVGAIGWSVVIALIASLLLSFTVIPSIAAFFLSASSHKKSFLEDGVSIDVVSRWYERTLRWSIHNPMATVIIGLLVSLPGFVVVGRLPVQFFPSADRDQLRIEFELQSSASIAETKLTCDKISKLIGKDPAIKSVSWTIGGNAPSIYYNMIGTRENSPNFAEAIVQLTSDRELNQTVRRLQSQIDSQIVNGEAHVMLFEQGPPYNAPIEIRIFGDNRNILREYGETLRGLMHANPDVIGTQADLSDYQPKITYQLDDVDTRLLNSSVTGIASQIKAAVDGSIGGSILEGNELLPVRVRLADDNRNKLTHIETMTLASSEPNSDPLPFLGSLAQSELRSESASISTLNGRLMNEVRGYLAAGVLPGTVLADLKKTLAMPGNAPPPGCWIEFSGEESKRSDAVSQLLGNSLVLVAAMLLVLVFSLGSFRATFAIFAIIGLSMGMALASLWILRYPLGFTAILGMMGMIGIAINDSIVVLAELRADAQASLGNPTAIFDIVCRSTRHVLSTTFTVGCSFIPMMIGGGTFWPPMAVVITAGVFGATGLALYWIPAFHILAQKLHLHSPGMRLASPSLSSDCQ